MSCSMIMKKRGMQSQPISFEYSKLKVSGGSVGNAGVFQIT